VYDKTVRRRRLVLGLLVASSLILLTVYFGESAGGGLHAIQRGAVEIVSPVQDVASRALKPARDLVGWFGDTFRAKGDVKKLRTERDALRDRLVAQTAAIRANGELSAVEDLMRRTELTDAGPVGARVTAYDPSLWYSQVQINKGSSDGVAVNQPVINGEGLVGVVSFVSSGTSTVRLLTDHNTAVSASVAESGVRGVVRPEAGRPNELVLDYTEGRRDRIEKGQTVVTAGTRANTAGRGSLFPRNLPIGRVTRVEDGGTDDQTVHLVPFVELRRVDNVQVLTKVEGAPTP
jgi:rod shape-determining protein MreC